MENKLYSIRKCFKEKILIFSFLVLAGQWTINSNAATITSTPTGGLWTSPATWAGGALPISTDDVVIANSSIVTVDTVSTVKSLTIGQGASGILQWGSSNNAITVTNTILIQSGASLLLYTAISSAATLNVGGDFTNNGFANLALGTLVFNGSGSQTLNGTGTFIGTGSNGIIRNLTFQNTGTSTISSSQNLIVTLNFIHSAGTLNTNGKLTIDNTAQVYGQAINTQVANIVITNMGTGYISAPVVSANGAILWTASGTVAVGNIIVSNNNVYAVTAGTTLGLSAPVHTTGSVTDGATLLWVGNIGTIGNSLIGTAVAGTQYFYGGNLYTCTVGGLIAVGSPPIHLSGIVTSGSASFLYVGSAAQVSVNYDGTTQTLRSLALTIPGSGLNIIPSLSILATSGSGALATVVYLPKIDGPNSVTTQKNPATSISGGIIINSTQGASSYSGVGGISTSNGGLNYTAVPTVGFSGPTAVNLVTAGGSGFTSAPTITITGTTISGSQLTSANFLITVDGGKIVSVYLNINTTAIYAVPPTLSFTGGGGSGATLAFPAGSWPTATAVIGANRQLSNFTITNPGFGYVAAPTVSVGTSGTFTNSATGLASRIALYNLTYTQATSNSPNTEGAEVPASRRMNSFTMNSIFGAAFTGNLELFSLTPLTLTSGKADFGLNTLTFSHASYLGINGSTISSISGGIKLSSIGGSLTKTFPFDRTVIVNTGTGSVTAPSSTITSLKITRTAAPTGTVTPNTNFITGTRTYRLETNIGAVYGTGPTVQLNFGSEDGLLSTEQGLLIAKAIATSGSWTVVSTTLGSGILVVPGTRTTSSFTGTGDDYLSFTTTTTPCNSTPTAGTIPAVVGFCGNTGSVTINLTGFTPSVSGLTFAWLESPNANFIPSAPAVQALGTNANAPIFISKIISSTVYYRCVVTCSGGGSTVTSNISKAGPVNCQYNVTRNTGITYSSIIKPTTTGSAYSSWTATIAGNDEFTNAVSLSGSTFLFQGVSVNDFYSSTNGFLSFNTAIPNAAPSNTLISGALTSQVLAPFWDDLTLRGTLSANRDNCMRYKINGTLGSGTADIIIEWADLERLAFGVPNLNFQVVLHELDNSIDFNYGNFQLYDGSVNPATAFTYSIGLNGTSPGVNTLSDRMILQRANQNFFSSTSQNSLSFTPECFSQLHFVPVAVYNGVDPGAPGAPANDAQANATTVAVNSAPCTVLCGNTYSSANATLSAGITACSAVTPGNPDDDVWFKFVATNLIQYKIDLTPSKDYDAVVQLLDVNLVPIQCVNANGIGLSESITATGNGNTYFIRIYDAGAGSGAGNGEFALCVSQLLAAPGNDDCGGAISLTVGATCIPTASVLPATLGATSSVITATGCTPSPVGLPDDDVWYSFVSSSGFGLTYNITVTGSSTYNAVVQLFSGTCGGSFTALNCVNATSNGGTETISTSALTTNTPYKIRVYHAGTGAASGNFTICVNASPPACPSGLLPANGTAVIVAGTTLSWTAVANANSYDVYFGTDSTAVANQSFAPVNQVGVTFPTGALVANTNYYWKIITVIGSFKSIGCVVTNLNTNPPPCVAITNPLNNSSICYKAGFNLTWTASFGANGYDVYLKKGAGPADSLIFTNQPGTSFAIPANTLSAGQWAWRVAPRSAQGINTTCASNIFTIVIPPIISILTTPVVPAVCNGQSITLVASGATSYFWSPSTGLNTTTGSTVIATTSSATTYTVTGEIVSGCTSTASQAITINSIPAAPTTTGFSLCVGGTIPFGQGLTASCVSSTFTNTISVPLSNPLTNETTTCPGVNVIGSFIIPPFPAGATITGAKLTINGITLVASSRGDQIFLNFSGAGIIGAQTCFQGSVLAVVSPVNWITGTLNANDTVTFANLINPAGGAVTIKYWETVSNSGSPDATFPATGSFSYTYTLSSSPKWYAASVGGSSIGTGAIFNPIPGTLPNSNVPGTYTYYARCESSLCPSLSTPANLVIDALVVNATQSATGSVCAGVVNQLNTVITGGSAPFSYSWSPTTGLSNATIANPTVSTLLSSTTYTVTVTEGCSNTASSSLTVLITAAPNVQISPSATSRCVSSATQIILTASGANTYTWLPSTGLSSTVGTQVIATPSITTNYTVTGTSTATGCTAKATQVITVGSTLTVSASATPTNVCQNGTSQLNSLVTFGSFYCATTQGGSPSITNVSFNTLSNPGIVSSTPFFETFPFGGNTTTQVIQGVSYSLTVDINGSGIAAVWIDYNRDGFYTSDEWTQVFTSGSTATVPILIPSNALSGVTGMRIRSRASTTVGPAEACTAFGSGSCQNYTITIGNPAPSVGYSWSPSTFLNNNAISNPFASGITGATTYTVTATNLTGGCTATSSVGLTIVPFTSVTVNPSGSAICFGSTQQFTGAAVGGSAPYTYSWAPSTSLSATTGSVVNASPASTTIYTLTIKDNCNVTISSSPFTLVVNPSPITSVTGNPSSLSICTSGSISLTANGANAYSWSPTFGLNNSTGQVVIASPVFNTKYTVTGTSNNCSSTASITVNYSPPITINATGDANPGCIPLTTTLRANAFNHTGSAANYIFSNASNIALNSMIGATQVISSNTDDIPTAAPVSIGFNFIYEGINYSTYSVSPDGWIKLGAGNASVDPINIVTSSNNVPRIFPFWDDLSTGINGGVSTLVIGTLPNRIFIVQWFLTIPKVNGGAANSTFQAWLYENGGKIEFHYGAMGTPTGTASIGITGLTPSNFNNVTLPNSASSIVENNNVVTKPTNLTLFTFTPSTYALTYTWTPSANLNFTTVANPIVSNIVASSTSYTVTVTNSLGCSASGNLTLIANPTPAAPVITNVGGVPARTFCQGGSVLLNATGSYTSYSWSNGTSVVGSTATYSATAGGTYTVTAFVANGCSASSSVVVNVLTAAIPSIRYPGFPSTSVLTFCQGSSILLNTSIPYIAYSWSKGGPPLGTGSTYAASSSGNYNVTVTAANGCTASSSSSILITVTPGPPNPVITATGNTTLCSNGLGCVLFKTTTDTTGLDLTWNNFDASTTSSINVCGDDLSFAFSETYPFHITVFDPISGCSSVSNDISLTSLPCGNGVLLYTKIFIQGFYTSNGLMRNGGFGFLNVCGISPDTLDVDTIILTAMAPTFPYAPIDTQLGILKTNGFVHVVFDAAAIAGNSYYIKINHHNSIETWSALPVLFTVPTTYLFATSASQAFSSNMIETPDNMGWAIYNGDVDQDGSVSGADFLPIDVDIQNGNGGYINTDLTGDGAVDGRDFLGLDANIQNGVGSFTP